MDEAIDILRIQVGITTQETDGGFESVTAEKKNLIQRLIKIIFQH